MLSSTGSAWTAASSKGEFNLVHCDMPSSVLGEFFSSIAFYPRHKNKMMRKGILSVQSVVNFPDSFLNLLFIPSVIHETNVKCQLLVLIAEEQVMEKRINNSLIEISFRPTGSQSIWLRPRPVFHMQVTHLFLDFRVSSISFWSRTLPLQKSFWYVTNFSLICDD